MNRFGLIDFWYYDYQEFYFKDGHMMLRGGNGSGKSVTMQSFLPLILDGNKSSSRLDPFGSRDRKIEDYLLDEKGERDNRIGYLFLEFKRKDLEIYKTVGIGMQARRNSQLNSWYFVIEDNKRIGKDIMLYERNLAITKQSLKNIIGDQLIETQGEYSRRVNEALFGFETEQEYKEVLDLMIQLRSPKLSNSLKPMTLNEILNNSLQPLSDEDLRPMSEAITSMDATKDQVLVLEENVKASQNIIDVYDKYNQRVLKDKIETYLQVEKETKATTRKTQTAIQELLEAETLKKDLLSENINLQDEMTKLQDEKSHLLREDLESLVHQAKKEKQEIENTNISIKAKETQINDKETSRRTAETDKNNKKDEIHTLKNSIMDSFKSLESIQTQLQFEEHTAIEKEFISNLNTSYDTGYTTKRITQEIKTIQDAFKRFDSISILENKYNTYLDITEKERFEKETLEKQLKKEHLKIQQLIESTIVSYYTWNQENQILKIDTPLLEDIAFEIEQTDTKDTSSKIQSLIYRVYTKNNANFIREEESLAYQLEKLRETQKILKDALKSWQEIKDPKLPLDETTDKNRSLLKSMNIKHTSLYELLEFDEGVSQTHRNQIEEKLRRTHLLGAQLISQNDLNKVTEKNHETSDHYLVTRKNIETLKPFILTEEFLTQKDYSEIFRALGIDDHPLKNQKPHYFYHGFHVVISTLEQAKYIGKKARETYRNQEIKRITLELEDHEDAIKDNLNKRAHIEQKINQLHQEYQNTPTLDMIHECRADISFNNKQLLEKITSINNLEKELEKIIHKTKEDRLYVSEIAHKLGISSTHDSFKRRKMNLEDYKDELTNMMNTHQLYLKDQELFYKYQSDINTLDEDIAILRDEVSVSKRKIDRLETSITNIETQLKQKGYEDIKSRLEAIDISLEEQLKQEKKNLETIGSLSTKIDTLTTTLQELKISFDEQVKKREKAQSIYEQELALGYVYDKNQPQKILKIIQETNPNLKNLREIDYELQEAIHNNRGSLQEYNVTRHSIFTEAESSIRLDISARYAGENINIKKLHDYLEKAIDEQKLLLEEKDRELIEEILINTISKKIRNRIQNSKAWVARMNRYMDGMNTSSGLKLSLNWQSKRGETEDELNSEKLVTLMERDVRLLRDEDKKALSKHFESKINLARKRAELEDTHESFHQIMSRIMDFRTWFSFKIMVQKQGERKKELTNNIFNTYSGGEKAMSMYIPLFSALAAKYEGGRKDAPLIIALDEAFAGVDENNIENMFELIRNFKFDYIMNSQVLWGDYPSVKSLAIYELFRPENVPYVTIVGYEWNGATKRMVT